MLRPPYEPLVPRHLRLEAAERSLYSGEILTELDEGEARAAAERLRDQGVEAVVIIDGRVPHAILLEVLTKEGIGTEIVL